MANQGSFDAPSDRGIAVQCRQITKEFGSGPTRARVLDGIDLDVYLGEQTFIVGPSGCGKTTLVSVIAGLLAATDGQLQVWDATSGRSAGASWSPFEHKI